MARLTKSYVEGRKSIPVSYRNSSRPGGRQELNGTAVEKASRGPTIKQNNLVYRLTTSVPDRISQK